jgi:hypothetical protein
VSPLGDFPLAPGRYFGTASLWAWWGSRCATAQELRVVEVGPSRVRVRSDVALAVAHLLLRLRRGGVPLTRDDTGGHNCRRIAGSSLMSLHGLGTAVDVNWSRNPNGQLAVTTMTPEAVRLVQELRLPGTSIPLWAWGGHWSKPDPMHWQVNLRPGELWWIH